MPVVKTKAIHYDKHLEKSMSYVENQEKTKISNNKDKMMSDEEIRMLNLQKQETFANNDIDEMSYLGNALKYAENELKTTLHDGDGILQDKDMMVTGINCNVNTALLEFRMAQDKYIRMHGKESYIEGTNKAGQKTVKEPVVAYHIVQSFPKYLKIDPREVNKMGQELVQKIPKIIGNDNAKFKAIVCTHMNTNSLHNHIVICNYSEDGKRKVPMTKSFRQELRDVSDEISIKHGFEIPPQLLGKKKSKSVDWIEWKAITTGEVKFWKEEIRNAIKLNASIANSFDDYIQKMRAAGYGITIRGEHITYATQDGTRRIRDNRLGDEYDTNTLKSMFQLEANKEIENEQRQVYSSFRHAKKHFNGKIIRNPRKEKIYISNYSESGRRRTALEKSLLFAIAVLKKIRDKYKNSNTSLTDPIFFPYDRKIKELEQAVKAVQRYGFESKADLDKAQREVGMELNIAKKAEKDAKESYEKHIGLQALISNAIELQTIATSLGIDTKDLYLDKFSATEIRKNRAEVMPATVKQKRELFTLLSKEENEYRLLYKMDELTYEDIEKSIQYLKDSKNEKPDFLVTQKEYDLLKAGTDEKIPDIKGLEEARIRANETSKIRNNILPNEYHLRRAIQILHQNGITDESLLIGSGKNGSLTKYDLIQIERYFNSLKENPMFTLPLSKQETDKMLKEIDKEGFKIARRENIITVLEKEQIIQWINKGCIEKYMPNFICNKKDEVQFTIGDTAKQIKELTAIRGITLGIEPVVLSKKEGYQLRDYLLHLREIPDCMKQLPEYKDKEITLLSEPQTNILLRNEEAIRNSNAHCFMDKISGYDEKEIMLLGKYRDTANTLLSLGINLEDIRNINNIIKSEQKKYEEMNDKKNEISHKYKVIKQAMKQYNFHLDKAKKIEDETEREFEEIKEKMDIINETIHYTGLADNPAFIYGPEYDRSEIYEMTNEKEMERELEQELQQDYKQEIKK